MSKKKKDKKSTAKRVAKAQNRKRQKRKLRLIKTNSIPEHKPVVHPPMAQVDAPPEKEILNMIQSIRHVGKDEAQDLLDRFVAKRNKMFPPEIQVKGSPVMFMRKEIPHLIAPFNYKELDFSEKTFPPDSNDKAFIESLVTMDSYIQSGKDYSDWKKNAGKVSQTGFKRKDQLESLPRIFHSLQKYF